MLSSIRAVLPLSLFFFLVGCSSKQPVSKPSKRPLLNKAEAIHKATLKPYTIKGVTYYPTIVEVGSRYRGTASWYGKGFHGKLTSSGEVYNMYDLTAAHKTLPMNTIVKVTNLRNLKSVVVRVNDRGPFVKNRIIDLSYAAAKRIGMVEMGTAPVELEVLGFDKTIQKLIANNRKDKKVILSSFAIQIGSFNSYERALQVKKKNTLVNGRYKTTIKTVEAKGKRFYRVWLVGFQSEQEAKDFLALERFPGAFVVRNISD